MMLALLVRRCLPSGPQICKAGLVTLLCPHVARYPVLMNPDVHWPAGADPQSLMFQSHDTQLLEAELAAGEQAAVSQVVDNCNVQAFLTGCGHRLASLCKVFGANAHS